MQRALCALPRVESASAVLPDPAETTMVVEAWQATSTTGSRDALLRLPEADRADDEDADATAERPHEVTANTAATTVRLAQLSATGRQRDAVRARAYYLERGAALTVKFCSGSAAGRIRLRREVAMRREVGALLPAPPLLDAGTTRGATFVVESVVFGYHPRTHAEQQAAATSLVDDLLALHRRAGVKDEPLELHARTTPRLALLFSQEWARAVTTADPARLASPVAGLLGDRRPVPYGWSNGNLDASRVIVAERGGPVIVDWEHAGRLPVATDLARLAVMTSDPATVVEHVVQQASSTDVGAAPDRMPVVDQLALLVVRELADWETGHRRAEAAGRLPAFERGISRRVRLLEHLVSVGAGRP